MNTELSRREGFTLVEAMIAILVFGICITGLCRLLIVTKETSDRARDHYVAVNIAKNRIEHARSFEFDQLSSFVENNTVVEDSGNPDSSGGFRRTTTVSNVSTGLVEIVVRVAIRDRESWTFGAMEERVDSFIADMAGRPQ